MINFNKYTQKIIFKTSIYTRIKVSPQIVVCVQDKHLMIVYTYYFLIQFVIRIYTFLKEWSDYQDQYQQLGIIWVNSNYKKAKTPSHIFYEYQNHTIPLVSGVIVWNFLVSTQLLKFVKIYLLKSLSKIKPIVNHRYPTIFYGIIFIQIFMITAPFLEIMISKFQKLLLFPILEPTSKLVYKNFLGILAVGILLDLFCDCLFKIIKILEYRASRFYTISEKISLVNLIVSLTIIFSLILAMFIYSSIIPDILYLEFFWNVPTYRILLVTSIFFFFNIVLFKDLANVGFFRTHLIYLIVFKNLYLIVRG